MNNKRGGVGAKILLVLILMLLAAGGGGYGYRVMDGKLAVRDAEKIVKDVDLEDYDTEEAAQLQVHINNVNKDLGTAQTRKEVYEIMDEFKEEVAKIKTKSEKELEAALREAEEARKANQSNQNYGNNSNNNNNNNNNGNSDNMNNSGSDANDQSGVTQNSGDSSNSSNTDSGYKSNDLSEAEDGTEDSGSWLDKLRNIGDDGN